MVNLPNEILLEVVRNYPTFTRLRHPDDVLEQYNLVKNTLASLCLVSKSWRDIAQPLLYRAYIKTEKNDPNQDEDEYDAAKIDAMEERGEDTSELTDEEMGFTGQRKPIQLEKFIRTMIERPDLAAEVECLSISNYWDEIASIERRFGRTDVNAALGEMMVEASKRVPPQEIKWNWRSSEWQESWRDDLREGDEVAEVALLMFLLPNIRWLDLGTSSADYGIQVQDIWRQLLGSQSKAKVEHHGQEQEIEADFLSQTGNPAILSRLEYFSARADSFLYKDAPTINTVSEILTIPSLKSFYGFGLQEEHWSYNVRLPLGHLKELFFNECRVSEEVLITLVDSCEQLESLDVAFSYYTDEISLSARFIYALARCKETLKELTLFLPDECDSRSRRELFINAPFDLRRLANLDTLSFDYDILFQERHPDPEPDHPDNVKFPHNLPESIERLNVENCRLDEDMARHAASLVATKQKYNKLKFVEFNFKTLEPVNDRERDQVSGMSLTAGVYQALGRKLSIVSDDDKVVVPHPAFDPRNRRQSDQEDGWSDMDEDEDEDEDEEMGDNDDGNVDPDQGRYDLRPRRGSAMAPT
ncbi:hypothetical protein D6D13_00375 [Aureobasidium pullulans]|uniref:Uncharacterized protein n=1 Tax=Aureobasidium pullulans TaxID=5580 RepID=A0A4S9DC55_AURPU|nr:hypothetical protein D6D13_00375 [Aureobasidium pullulans]